MLDVQLTSLEHNIREGNSVINGPVVHPKAVGWRTALRKVIAEGGVSNVAPAECWSVRGERAYPQPANP
jgi:hypothetical protein